VFVADVALASTFRRYLLDRVDEQLAETAERIADFASGPLRGRPGRGGPGPGRGPALTEFYVGIAGPDGRLLRRFDTPLRRYRGVPELDPAAVRGAATGPGEPLRPFAADGAHHAGWRVVALQVTGADQIVVVGAGLADVDPTYRRMVGVLVAATAAVLATLAAVAWWVLRQGVRPLAAMTATAGAIAAGALHERVAEVDERTEAGRLGLALNTMLGRIERAFADRAASQARLHRFVATPPTSCAPPSRRSAGMPSCTAPAASRARGPAGRDAPRRAGGDPDGRASALPHRRVRDSGEPCPSET
jgi:two-component system OmpR family sensor kinase